MHEDQGSALSKGKRKTTCCAQSRFAMCGLQDLPRQEARSSWETQSDAQSFRETGCNIVDYRIPGISFSTVQQQDEHRQQTVAKLIEKFDSHQYEEQFKDMSQTQKIIRFGEASQKLPKDMDQTEIFELCENITKRQCLDCNSFTDIAIIYCSCGRNLKYKQSPTTVPFDNYDFDSIPGYIVKKNSSRGPKHDQSERQKYVLQGETHAKKSEEEDSSDNSLKMESR